MKNYSILLLLFFYGCVKEKTTNYYANIKNNTTHSIVIKPYSFGQVVTENIINLPSFSSKQIANGTERGLNGNSGFSSRYLDNCDSLRVTFDNIYTITHYNFDNPSPLNIRYYLNTSFRNIINYKSYSFESKSLTKYQIENIYNFEFKEQDYLDAKP